MNQFKNILYVVQNDEIPDFAFEQTAKVLNTTKANLTILVLHSKLSNDLENIQELYKKSISDAVSAKLKKYNFPDDINILLETATPHFITIIQHVLKQNYDLVIKAAENIGGKEKKGFKSLDMSLLRKCPCPVWLCRDFMDKNNPKILTAIDPFSDQPEGHDLNIKLLQMGEALAASIGGSNRIISCWDYEYEGFLRNSPFGKMEDAKVDVLVQETKQKHENACKALISEAKIKNSYVSCKRGEAHEIIPTFAESENISIVVMGTVARTGIPGFFIGNTAENILQNFSCGMFAVKPNGFISPIKAY